jgi:hypothetical protein
MSYDRDALLAFFKPNIIKAEVTVEGKTQEIFVKELSAEEVFDLQSKRKKNGDENTNNKEFAKQLLSTALVDEDGHPLFTKEDVGRLFGAKIKVFNELSRVVAGTAGLDIAPTKEKEGASPKEGDDDTGKAG